jgi:hypothetical protein
MKGARPVKRRLTRPLALGAVGVLAVAGGGIAYAATSGGGNPRDAILRDAAQRLGVSPDKLRSALQSAFGDQLDHAVKDGRLTQQQADRIKQALQRGGGLPLLGPGPRQLLFFGGPHVLLRGGLKVAAGYLGLTPAQLHEQLRAGKSLADVAKAQGKDVKGLEDALVAAAKTKLDQAVKDGRLTSAKHDAILKDVQQHVADLVSAKGGALLCGPGGPGAPGGPRMMWRQRQGSGFARGGWAGGDPPPPPGMP